MASSAHMAAVLNLPLGFRFRPSDRQIIANHLGPMALHGADSLPQKGDVVEGVDVFATRPDAIPFERRHVWGRNEVRAHYFGDQPTDSRGREVPGGAWLPCGGGGGGGDKAYCGADGEEAVAYRRKYEFRAAAEEADRAGEVARPRWRMKEYRLNKSAAAFRRAYAQPNPKANMDCVVREIYTKAAVPPPTPPSGRSGDEEMQEGSDYSVMDEDFEDEDDDDDELVDYLLQDFEDGDSDEDQNQPAAAEDGEYSDEDQP
uniref:NAC domain-containing protein n=1 Tax=Oryza punctata TaxID=4537 RepID=A0A0E0KRU9_ORYPU